MTRRPRSDRDPADGVTPIDRSMKALIREVPEAFVRLAGVGTGPSVIQLRDVTVNVPEHRADQVLVIGDDGDPHQWGWHLEYQLAPDRRRLEGWLFKNAALNRQMRMPVVLTVVYLTREGRRRFPEAYAIRGGGIENRHRFHVIRLWEHIDRIRSGELAQLAPLLVLCEDNPRDETLQLERDLILRAAVPEPVRSELLAVALTVGARYFSRDLLYEFFRKELEMVKGSGIVEEWVNEAAEKAAESARTAEARAFLLMVLGEKYGTIPSRAMAAVEAGSHDWCHRIAQRALRGETLQELGLD